MSATLAAFAALQLAAVVTPQTPCDPAPGYGLSGVVAEVSRIGSDREYGGSEQSFRLGLNGCTQRPSLSLTELSYGDGPDPAPLRLSAYSRFHRPNDGSGQGSSLGLAIELNSETVHFPSMAIVAGVDRRTVFVAPGIEGFQRPVVNMSQSLDVADGYGGVAWRLSPERFVSVSYVRQERSFNSGMTEWREQDHFVGFVFNQRW